MVATCPTFRSAEAETEGCPPHLIGRSLQVRPPAVRGQEYSGIINTWRRNRSKTSPFPLIPEPDIREAGCIIREASRLTEEANRLEREGIGLIDIALPSGGVGRHGLECATAERMNPNQRPASGPGIQSWEPTQNLNIEGRIPMDEDGSSPGTMLQSPTLTILPLALYALLSIVLTKVAHT